MGSRAAEPEAGRDRPVAGARCKRDPVLGDGAARLPLRDELVARAGPRTALQDAADPVPQPARRNYLTSGPPVATKPEAPRRATRRAGDVSTVPSSGVHLPVGLEATARLEKANAKLLHAPTPPFHDSVVATGRQTPWLP